MSERLRTAVFLVLFVGGVAWIYAQTLGHAFVLYDDDQYVYENAQILAGVTTEGLGHVLTRPHSINWHPLTSLSHMLDVELFGTDAGAHHGTNVALHALATVLLFAALASMTGARWTSAGIALLFAVHPLRVESVAWVSERKDVLSGVFFAATLLAYAAWVRRPSFGRHLLVTLALIGGLLAKPMLVSLPVLFLVLDRWPLGSSFDEQAPAVLHQKRLRSTALWWACAFSVGLLTLRIQANAGAVRPFEAFDLPTRLATAAAGLTHYLEQSVVPHDLAFFHPHPSLLPEGVGESLALRAGLGVVLLVAISFLTWRTRSTRPWLACGWLWFLVVLAPVSGLVQAGEQAWANRYAYLPTIGLYVAVGFELRARCARNEAAARIVCVGTLALAFVFSLQARRQAATWATSERLFTHALEVTEGNYMAANNLGLVRLEEGRFDEASALFETALTVRPQDRKARINLGLAWASAGREAEALAHLRGLADHYPNEARLHANLGSLLARTGELAEARASLRHALQLDSNLVEPLLNLAQIELIEGRPDEATTLVERALLLRPGHARALSLRDRAHALRRAGEKAQATTSGS